MQSNTDIKTNTLRPRLRATGLVLPLLAFIAITFVAPLATMLVQSVYDPTVADTLPETLNHSEKSGMERVRLTNQCTQRPHASY